MKFQLPDMKLVAVGSEREFNLAKLNRPTLLGIQNEYSADIAEIVAWLCPDRYAPRTDEVSL